MSAEHAPQPPWRDAALAPPRAGDGPVAHAWYKAAPQDFRVVEIPSHPPDGEGPHLWLEVEREGMNTEFAARILARAAGVAPRDVGYAGLKDRHALTRQWFSLPWTGAIDSLVDTLSIQGLRIVASARNARKLRRGALAGNRFTIRVRSPGADTAAVAAAVARMRRDGVPNYFGPQRFGLDGGNLDRSLEMLCAGAKVRDRHRRGLYLSAARSALFNRVLACRVQGGSWCRLLPGEAVALDGSSSYFSAELVDAALERRLDAFDVHPSGPLWGRGPSPARGEAALVESRALSGFEPVMEGLARAGLEHARRALRVAVPDLAADRDEGDGWRLAFALPAGAYATVVLREIFELRDASAPGAV